MRFAFAGAVVRSHWIWEMGRVVIALGIWRIRSPALALAGLELDHRPIRGTPSQAQLQSAIRSVQPNGHCSRRYPKIACEARKRLRAAI